jgi:diguanylate cyclase (GGDEF)-like protein/PAS domain S-box-containing protein
METFSEPIANHGSWEYEVDTGVVRWSPTLYRIHGVAPADFQPTRETISGLVHPEDRDGHLQVLIDAIQAEAPFAFQHRIVLPGGDERVVLVRGSFLDAQDGSAARLVGTTHDVTGREGQEERLWHLANHDSLSGLFNRRRFMEELTREVAFAHRSGEPGAVLVLDLDRFKDINDSLGHGAGDSLLTHVAERLRERLRSTDTLARLGGDEFAVVLPGCPVDQARRVAGEILQTLYSDATVRIAGVERGVTASVGIAPFGPGREASAEELLVEADLAMYRAKATGRGQIEIFDEEMRAKLAARMSLEGELREAVAGGELRVQYQPIVALRDGTAVGCEALVRWEHPLHGLVGPDEFIAIAEETGLIGEIGEFVLDGACRQAAEWRNRGRPLCVSVNVSPRQLVTEDMARTVVQALRQSGLPAPLLCVEVTETALLADSEPLVSAMRELEQVGVRTAIDDFGGGASSLGLLRVLPLDQIKIDRMFVKGIVEQPDDRAIVAAVLSLADELGMTVVAEGIETEQQQVQLKALGCQFGQGFLYARPAYPETLAFDGFPAVVPPGPGALSANGGFGHQIGIPAHLGDR